MGTNEPGFIVFEYHIRVNQLTATFAETFDFPSAQAQARLEFRFDSVFVLRTFVQADGVSAGDFFFFAMARLSGRPVALKAAHIALSIGATGRIKQQLQQKVVTSVRIMNNCCF